MIKISDLNYRDLNRPTLHQSQNFG